MPTGYPALQEIAPLFSTGIVTARDSFTIRWSDAEAVATVEEFARTPG